MTTSERGNSFRRLVDRSADRGVRRAIRAGRTRRRPVAVDVALPVVVTETVRAAPDAVELRLAAPDGSRLPRWWPGAHVDLALPSGRVRQYSLCGDPADRHSYRIVVRRIEAGNGGSREVHTLGVGDPVTLRGPRNAFPLVAASSYLFLAGGIGITPIAPMVRAAAERGVPWRLVHTGRDAASLPLSGALAAAYGERVQRRSDAEHGGPPSTAELLADLAPGTAVYCCGPPPMIDAVRVAVPATTPFHSERFSPAPIRGGAPFTVQLGVDGPIVDVAADRSALDAVLERFPDVGYSCRQGFCGTCHVPLLAGESVGDPAGPGRMSLCVGRAAGDGVVISVTEPADNPARNALRSAPQAAS